MPSSSFVNSTSFELGPSIAAQKAFIIGELGSTLAFLYMLGIYSGLYMITAYMYLFKGHASVFQKAFVIGTLTSLYIVLATLDITNWYTLATSFRKLGYLRKDIYDGLTTTEYPPKISAMILILEYSSLILSDVLMLWRCFHACGRSFWRFAIPFGSFIAEFILISAQISLILIGLRNPRTLTHWRYNQEDIIAAAIFGTAGATSITSTFIICRTIYSNTSRGGRSRARYKYIVDIVIQSSAIYSTTMLLVFIFDILSVWRFTEAIHISGMFIVNLAFGMTGFLPTLMVARLAFASGREDNECVYPDLPSSGERNSSNTEAVKQLQEQQTSDELAIPSTPHVWTE